MIDDKEFARRWAPTLHGEKWPFEAAKMTAEVIDAVPVPDVVAGARAFVTDIDGKTLVTGPAQVAAFKEPTVEDIAAQSMLRMQGRFVGADTPNRNGAYWTSADLQLAAPNVINGPLNWLHEARHVIGCLTDASFVSREQSEQLSQPHINASAGVWKWLYPDEAYVVEQASDLQQLWYSMECISKNVTCAGDNGCGNTTSYTEYMQGAACEHVKERGSVRHFVDPVFLGGAVIVPPTRPGWAAADASVMKPAAKLAEAAYEQAGQPEVSASVWEQVMAQLVMFARD